MTSPPERDAAVTNDWRQLRAPLDELQDPLPIPPLDRPFYLDYTPPGSKSLTIRALVLAAIADGESTLRRPLTGADDVERTIDALAALGARTQRQTIASPAGEQTELRVQGCGGTPRGGVTINLNNSGAATRFLTAASALATGPVTIDGSPRMRQRPIGELTGALKALGARVDHLDREGFPPVLITPPDQSVVVSEIELGTTASSQFISALLLIAPWTKHGLTIRLKGAITSRPYIAMTINMLKRLGACDVQTSDDFSLLHVGARPIEPFTYDIEPDATGATYFLAAAAMTPGSRCLAHGFSKSSLQGDAKFIQAMASMGASASAHESHLRIEAPSSNTLTGSEIDCSAMPDTAMTTAAAACFADSPTLLTGLRTLRSKETDRIAALQHELAKIDAKADIIKTQGDESLKITPPTQGVDRSANAPRVEFDTYDDHRMAMSLALIGLRRPNVWIRDPGCVAKTYPSFWSDFARLYDPS